MWSSYACMVKMDYNVLKHGNYDVFKFKYWFFFIVMNAQLADIYHLS